MYRIRYVMTCVFVLLTATALPATSCLSANEPVLETTNLAEARELATGHYTYIVVDYWHRFCGPCKAFARAVHEDESMQQALAGLVLLTLNVEEPEGEREAERHNVHQFPTYQLLNTQGEIVDTWIGYHNPGWWIGRLQQALVDPVSQRERAVRFEAEPNVGDALVLGKAAYTAQHCREAFDYLRRAQALDPEAAEAASAALFLFLASYEGVVTGEFTLPEVVAVTEEVLRAPDVNPEHVVEIGEALLKAVPIVGEEPLLPSIRLAHSRLPGRCEGEWEVKRQRFLLNFTVEVEKDHEQALRYKRAFLPANWQDDPEQINAFAWWCFENRLNLPEAEHLSRRAVGMVADGSTKANYLDTLAELVNLRGDRVEALALVEEALVLDPSSSYLREQQVRFSSDVEHDEKR